MKFSFVYDIYLLPIISHVISIQLVNDLLDYYLNTDMLLAK